MVNHTHAPRALPGFNSVEKAVGIDLRPVPLIAKAAKGFHKIIRLGDAQVAGNAANAKEGGATGRSSRKSSGTEGGNCTVAVAGALGKPSARACHISSVSSSSMSANSQSSGPAAGVLAGHAPRRP
jgi:hypothetical protein